jgi:AbrB family looped-hinge helix DNA binding protein
MANTIKMDKSGRVVLPRAVRERFGLTGGAHEMEVIETPDGIVLRPVGDYVPMTRDPSGWVVFHSNVTSEEERQALDPVAQVAAMREQRNRDVYRR